MQQSSATPQKLRCRDWVAEDCCMLSLLLAVPSCIYRIFTLVSLIFSPGLALTVARGERPYVVRALHV